MSEGLLPYRDFPMFHLPNLAFVYAALDRLTHQPVFSAKVLNALASTGIVTLIFLAGTARPHPVALAPRHFWYALAVVALLLTDQLFTYTTGQTWNHELPAFLLIAAIHFSADVGAVERACPSRLQAPFRSVTAAAIFALVVFCLSPLRANAATTRITRWSDQFRGAS
jgi:hypothetical protein